MYAYTFYLLISINVKALWRGWLFFFLLEVFRLGAALEKESISISISICMRDIKGPQYVTIAARLAVLD